MPVADGGVIDGMAVIAVDAPRYVGQPRVAGPAIAAGRCPALLFSQNLRLRIEDGFSRCSEVRGCGALVLHFDLGDILIDSAITVVGLINGFLGRDLDLGYAVIDSTITVLGIVDALIGGDICLGISLEIRVNLRLHLGQLALLQALYLRAEGL
jgi:hypothetical protein